MKPKLILCLALVLSGIYTAFAFAISIQLKPTEMQGVGNVLIKSKIDFNTGYRNYWVIILLQTNFPNSNSQGHLELYDGTNRLASCSLAGNILSDVQPRGWNGLLESHHYVAMTNLFSRPLNGAKLFTFQVATNLLEKSEFRLTDDIDTTYWFFLKNFSDEK